MTAWLMSRDNCSKIQITLKLFLELFNCLLKPFESIYQSDIEGFFDKCLNPEQRATNLFQTWIYILGTLITLVLSLITHRALCIFKHYFTSSLLSCYNALILLPPLTSCVMASD